MSEYTKAYDARHRVAGTPIYSDGFVYFADGAVREEDQIACCLREPPADPHLNAKKRLVYWRIRLELAQARFHDMKAELLRHEHPSKESLNELKSLAATAKECKQRHDEVVAEVDRTDPHREAKLQAAKMAPIIAAQKEKARQNVLDVNI